MAFRSWLKLLAATTTAAAVVGAGQLGIAYGLGMVRLDQTLELTQRDQWTAQLAWVAWITMSAAALGAVVATGLRPRWSPRPVSAGGALAMGLAAGLGALAVLPLTMQPARTAQVAGVHPVLVIGICAGLGAAVGIFAGYAAAARAVARWSVSTSTIAVWLIALISIVPSLLPGRTPESTRLGVLGGALVPAAVAEHTRFVTMPVIALIAGLIIGWIARGRKMPLLTVALSGLPGPALLTVAYLIAGPGSPGGFHPDPYWGAMTAAGAGVLGSVLAAVVRGAPEPAGAPEPETPHGDSPVDTRPEPAPATASGRPGPPPATGQTGPPPATPSGRTEPAPAPGRAEPAPATSSGPGALPRRRRNVSVQSAIAQAAAAAARRPENELRPSDTGVLPIPPGRRPHPLQDTNAAGLKPATGHPPTAPDPAPYTPAHASMPTATGQEPATPEPRFSGQQRQQPAKATGGLRRGWRTRKPAPEPQPAAPSPALTGDTGSFNGFATSRPGPRVGIDTAEHPRITQRAPLTPEPTPISAAPPQPTPVAPPPAVRGAKDRKEDDYVDWVNGLGGA